MMSATYRYLFGPVPSRRFGRSLGVDLLCARRCSFDCVFCEVGDTDLLTVERAEYVPTADVIGEIHDWLDCGGVADVITLAGMGEPTLHTGFGDIIDAVHASCAIPVVLLTNGTLFGDAGVRAAAARADVVKASLSAWDDASLARLNRPADALSFERLMDGLREFRREFDGPLWIEVMLVRGINDEPGQVARIAALAAGLHPDKIQLNTVVRPPAAAGSEAVPGDVLQRLAPLFTPVAEVIAPWKRGGGAVQGADDTLLRAMLARRPCTARDIADSLGLSIEEATSRAERLRRNGDLQGIACDGILYYSAWP